MNYEVLNNHLGEAQEKHLKYGETYERNDDGSISYNMYNHREITYYPNKYVLTFGKEDRRRIASIHLRMYTPFIMTPCVDKLSGAEYTSVCGHRYFNGMQLSGSGELLNPEDVPVYEEVPVVSPALLKIFSRKLRAFRRTLLSHTVLTVGNLTITSEDYFNISETKAEALQKCNKPSGTADIGSFVSLVMDGAAENELAKVKQLLLRYGYAKKNKPYIDIYKHSLLLIRPIMHQALKENHETTT